MKQQIVSVYGGIPKENFKDFYEYIEKIKYEPFKEKKKWKYFFRDYLGDNYELLEFDMPNKDFADYNAWKIMFEKSFNFLKNDVILVGHSLGGSFLTKYLEENEFPVKIKHIILIASAFKDSKAEVLGNFNFNKNLDNFSKYEDIITFFYSKDDLVVPFDDCEDYKKVLPNSIYKIYEDKFHFIDKEFPELIDYINKIK